MSLVDDAQRLAAHGRHGDTMLAHINPQEAALLKAHGGSGTINPHTGLPEFFNPLQEVKNAVSSVTSNPITAGLAGLALNSFFPGAGTAVGGLFGLGGAAGTGLLMGGIGALATGSLQKGILAGLGAYGGASIGQGIGRVGLPAAQDALLANAPMDISNEELTKQLGAIKPTDSTAMAEGLKATAKNPMATLKAIGEGSALKGATLAAAPLLVSGLSASQPSLKGVSDPGAPAMIRPYSYTRNPLTPDSPRFGSPMLGTTYKPGQDTSERLWFDQFWTPGKPYPASDVSKYADGGPVENMSQANSVGLNTGYPMADIAQGAYATPYQTPISRNVVSDGGDANVDTFTGNPRGMAAGGLGSLGGYSDGGRMLKGPGDGMSDNIPAVIAGKQPARLADGEFVVPADVVSHLGNGSTDAGARQLYKMMDRIRQQRTGKKKQAPEVNPTRAMPA